MKNISNEFVQAINEGRRDYLGFADITLANGIVLNINNSDIWENGLKIDSGVSANGVFSIGAAISSKLTLTLNNIDDKFSPYDFDRAQVVVYVGMQLSNTLERIRMGTFIVDDPRYNGSSITLECLDYISLLREPYSRVKTTYPAHLSQIVREICNMLNLTLLTTTFGNDLIVMERPKDEAMTCLDVIAYAAQIACKYVKADEYGRIKLEWYDQEAFEESRGLDGGIFDHHNPYASGDVADGGSFNPWNTGHIYDASTFAEQKLFHHIWSLKSFNVKTDDVVITGIRVTEDFPETETAKPQTYQTGSDGYVINISGNKLIQTNRAKVIADYLASQLVGLRFRPLTTQLMSNPAIETGDFAFVTDRKSNTYRCLISNLSYNMSGFQTLTCDAETPKKNSATTFSDTTKAIVEARQNTQAQLTAYDLAMQQLTSLLTQSFGAFRSEEVLEDGSTIFYIHNKPKLEESQTIWRMAADVMAVSTDGGQTWNAGIDSQGNAVLNVLSVIGINFDWARGGTLTLGGQSNTHGVLRILNASGNQIGTWDNNGINATNGVFGGVLNGATGTFSTSSGGRTVYLGNGMLELAHGGAMTAVMSTGAYTAGNSEIGGMLYTYEAFLVLGSRPNQLVGTPTTSRILINNGLNPSGHNQAVFLYGDVRIGSTLFLGNAAQGVRLRTTNMQTNPPAPVVAIDGGGLYSAGGFYVGPNSPKARVVDVAGGYVTMNAVESAGAFFQDYGSGEIDENGECFIFLDPIFEETIDLKHEYYVQITPTSTEIINYTKKENGYFIVHGETGATFDWVVSAKQKKFEMDRMEKFDIPDEQDFSDIPILPHENIEELANKYLDQYEKEIELC